MKKLFKLVLGDEYKNQWLCTSVRPAYKYDEHGNRTDTVEGTVYHCLHPQALDFGHVDIKVLGEDPVIDNDDCDTKPVQMSFKELSFTEWRPKGAKKNTVSGRAVSAKADPHA